MGLALNTVAADFCVRPLQDANSGSYCNELLRYIWNVTDPWVYECRRIKHEEFNANYV